MWGVQRSWVAAGACAVTLAISGLTHAQDLTYEPVNPSFGGDPFNSNHLLQLSQQQNKFDNPQPFERPSAQEQFADSLERRILSRTSQTIVDRIFGEEAQESGNFTVGSQEIEFQQAGDQVRITLRDLETGATTNLTIPTPRF